LLTSQKFLLTSAPKGLFVVTPMPKRIAKLATGKSLRDPINPSRRGDRKMKKSRRLFLPDDDYDRDLVTAQMRQKFVMGMGFCGSNEGAITDPLEIVGKAPSEVAGKIRKAHEAVLLRSMTSR
jgi:hypothetical protein